MKRLLLAAGVSACALAALPCFAAETATATPSASADAQPSYAPWGFDLKGRDTAVKPGDNFFGYANGTAVRDMVIPPDRTNFGAFVVLADLSEKRVHQILDDASAHAQATPADGLGKAGALYRAFMDEASVEKRGAAPLAPELADIRGLKTAADFATLQGKAQTNFQGSLFAMSIEPDAKDPTKYAITIGQAGLGLPDRDYYLAKQFAEKKAKYPGFITRMLTLAGWPDPAGSAAKILAFEQKIAEVSWSRAEDRDPDKTYNPMSFAELQKQVPGFDWAAFFKAAGLGAPDRVVLGEKSAIEKIAALAGATPIGTLQAWAAFHLATNAAPVLSKDFVAANFDFNHRELQGQPQERPRWKRAVAAVEAALGEAVGQQYVKLYYPPDARAKMEALTHDLRDAFRNRLEHNTWMSPPTKHKALEKLAAFDFQIGYPKKWRDYASLKIDAGDLYGDVERGSAFEWNYWVGHLGHKVDRDEWEMLPQTVNAYNQPTFNEVVFPAAILQPPFFNKDADPAINYGAIGGVIGHEMTHGFDDEGRKFDALGRLHDWWTPDDARRFDELSKKYGAQFAAMDILPGAHINPELTMGENIADLGGLTLAYDAYKASLHGKPAPVLDGLTGEQRVFLGWAQVWRAKLRPDAERQRLVVDPHSPPVARVNGPMPNVEGWYEAWRIQPGEKLYRGPGERVIIW
jgi:putative endopeptidase